MGRKPRMEFKGAIFHVIKRGNNREYIFRAEIDKEHFLTYLDHANTDGVFNLLGYVIMDNHYHLIIGTKEKSLDKIMQQANNAYSKNYNILSVSEGSCFVLRMGNNSVNLHK